MTANLDALILTDLTRSLTAPAKGTPAGETGDLDDLFREMEAKASGTDRESREAIEIGRAVLLTLQRYAGLMSGLVGGRGARTLERERGRWAELVDSTRVRMAKGAPVVIYESRPRGRLV